MSGNAETVDDAINRRMVYCGLANPLVSLVHAGPESRWFHGDDVPSVSSPAPRT